MEDAFPSAPLIQLVTRHLTFPSCARLYAFSDVHGFFAVLQSSLRLIDRDLEEHPLRRKQPVFALMLGDINDKGADTRKCVELFSDYGASREKNSDFAALSLIGNHEKYMIDFLNGPQNGQTQEDWAARGISWIQGGGDKTFTSYGVQDEYLKMFRDVKKQKALTQKTLCGTDMKAVLADPLKNLRRLRRELADKIDEAGHLGFYRDLQTTISSQHFVFCHAQIKPDKNVRDHAIDEVITGHDITSYEGAFKNGSVVVYGHSDGRYRRKDPGSDPPRLKPNSIGIEPRAIRNGKPFIMTLDKGGMVRFLFDGNREVGPVLYTHQPNVEVAPYDRKPAEVSQRPQLLGLKEILQTMVM